MSSGADVVAFWDVFAVKSENKGGTNHEEDNCVSYYYVGGGLGGVG